MTDFERARSELAAHNREIARKREEALLAREAVRRNDSALREAVRRAGDGNAAEIERLRAKRKQAAAKEQQMARELAEMQDRAVGLERTFAEFSDPRAGLERWPARYPILLFPLRIETRFKKGPAGQSQLWVRVYPDTCLIDSFEASLTDQEIANARAFWAGIWRAGGDEVMERTAWRDLVASHGSGRAAWIARQYLPLNPSDKPVRDNATDVLLIIPAGAPIAAAAASYWRAAWVAGDSAVATKAAYDALELAVGVDAAKAIAADTHPMNFSDTPAAGKRRDEVQVKVAVMQLTPPDQLETRRTSWSSPARVELLPDRFVLLGYSGGLPLLVTLGAPIPSSLFVSPDPNAPPEQQLKPDGDQLSIPQQIAWMFDFAEARRVGMAFQVDLTPAQAKGFDRLIVLGVRLGDSAPEGKTRLEALLEHQLHSRGGLELLPQGVPTNNTEQGGSGYSFRDDSDASFEPLFRQTPAYTPENDPLLRRDGEWIAKLLGLSDALLQQLPNAASSDQGEARAMQAALWPGTLGYAMKTLMAPVFSDDDIAATRAFVTRYVSGRGPLPAIRIGDQPYGILPVTAFNRLNWFGSDASQPFTGRLYQVLKQIRGDWDRLLEKIRRIGTTDGDPHQVLLDVLGLHASSAEYYPLLGETTAHKYYELSFLDYSAAELFLEQFPVGLPLALLRGFGYAGTELPDILKQLYRAQQTPLTGPVIDDRPLSERDPIRRYAGTQNYIQWLVSAAGAGIAAIQEEQGFDGGVKPAALLYLLLRNALQLALREAAISETQAAGIQIDARAMRREPAFVHVVGDAARSESRYDLLVRPEPRVTRNPTESLGSYIARNLKRSDPDLREQVQALERLSLVPTARLERLFAEHIDVCSYRLDAWTTGLLTRELERMQGMANAEQPAGLYLGAFGWVEDLAPENKVLTPAKLPTDLVEPINRRDAAPLMKDSTNEGLIHAPSLNHATTAAVLRNGYVANDGRLAVNLSSRRVRQALGILEGMRNGQSLGALLGYQFERYLHDNGPLQVRALVYPLRRAYPLVANQITDTASNNGPAREATAAMNVVDGRKLIEQAEKAAQFAYPFGDGTLPRTAAIQEQALTDALGHIRDVNDAVADLVLAEGVHQAVLGNYDRSAGTLDAFAKGNFPPEVDVMRTPRSGTGLTLRTAVHLPPQPAAPVVVTPLAAAEPAINAWLSERLPVAGRVGCNVSFTSRATNTVTQVFVRQAQLGLNAIDLVYRLQANTEQALGDLDDRILTFIHANEAPRYDRPITIHHTDHVAGSITWFELQALLTSLRAVVASRPLRPGDLLRQNDATRSGEASVSLDRAVIKAARDDLHDTLLPALAPVDAALANAAVTVDAALSQYVDAVAPLAAYRLPQTGTGFVFEWRADRYTSLVERMTDRLTTWGERRTRYQTALDAYDALGVTPEDERIARLQAIEMLITTALSTPQPANSGLYRLALDGVSAAFDAKRAALQQLVDVARATLDQLLTDVKNQLPLTAFDPDPIDFGEDDAEIARFRTQVRETLKLIVDDTTKRLTQVDTMLVQHDASAASEQRVKLLQQAARLLFGEDFQLVPSIALPQAALDEVENAYLYSQSGGLTNYLTTSAGRDFPMDDWLHGVARVREKMYHWENVVLLDNAVRPDRPVELTPLQLPHYPNEAWLGLETPPNQVVDGERLLYTAHFAEPFDRTKPIRGLLVDEWTEVIPGATEETGIAFHYDRPNCEPPQTWLVALPASFTGSWSWDDLVDAVLDALDSARRRALEPAHLDSTAYSFFLPATTSAYTFPEISISNNLLRNRRIYAVEKG